MQSDIFAQINGFFSGRQRRKSESILDQEDSEHSCLHAGEEIFASEKTRRKSEAVLLTRTKSDKLESGGKPANSSGGGISLVRVAKLDFKLNLKRLSFADDVPPALPARHFSTDDDDELPPPIPERKCSLDSIIDEGFQGRFKFRPVSTVPLPEPFTDCKKTYPSKTPKNKALQRPLSQPPPPPLPMDMSPPPLDNLAFVLTPKEAVPLPTSSKNFTKAINESAKMGHISKPENSSKVNGFETSTQKEAAEGSSPPPPPKRPLPPPPALKSTLQGKSSLGIALKPKPAIACKPSVLSSFDGNAPLSLTPPSPPTSPPLVKKLSVTFESSKDSVNSESLLLADRSDVINPAAVAPKTPDALNEAKPFTKPSTETSTVGKPLISTTKPSLKPTASNQTDSSLQSTKAAVTTGQKILKKNSSSGEGLTNGKPAGTGSTAMVPPKILVKPTVVKSTSKDSCYFSPTYSDVPLSPPPLPQTPNSLADLPLPPITAPPVESSPTPTGSETGGGRPPSPLPPPPPPHVLDSVDADLPTFPPLPPPPSESVKPVRLQMPPKPKPQATKPVTKAVNGKSRSSNKNRPLPSLPSEAKTGRGKLSDAGKDVWGGKDVFNPREEEGDLYDIMNDNTCTM